MTTHPFEFVDSDLVLRATAPCVVDFHVHRCILSAASPFFAHMFTLPQAPSSQPSTPLIEVSEDRTTLETLLRIIYPMSKPKIETLDELTLVLDAAFKYEMSAANDFLRSQLVAPRFVESAPVRVYAIASRFDLEEEAKVASRHTLSVQVLDCPLHEDLKHITAFSYHQLLNLHHRRAQAAQELMKISDNVKCMRCNAPPYGTYTAPKWWEDFEARATKELAARPTTDVIFSMAFLAQSAQAGCERCAGSILDAYWFLQDLKKKIDDLPSTI